jgi:hypothetical protein
MAFAAAAQQRERVATIGYFTLIKFTALKHRHCCHLLLIRK